MSDDTPLTRYEKNILRALSTKEPRRLSQIRKNNLQGKFRETLDDLVQRGYVERVGHGIPEYRKIDLPPEDRRTFLESGCNSLRAWLVETGRVGIFD